MSSLTQTRNRIGSWPRCALHWGRGLSQRGRGDPRYLNRSEHPCPYSYPIFKKTGHSPPSSLPPV